MTRAHHARSRRRPIDVTEPDGRPSTYPAGKPARTRRQGAVAAVPAGPTPGRVYHATTGEFVACRAVVPGLKTVNPLNRREHHFARASRVRKEKWATLAALRATGRAPPLPVVVTLTRVSAQAMDSDGAIASLKSVRDATALHLGVDDRDSPRLVWRYRQKRGPMGVEILIEPLTTCSELDTE